MSRERSESRFAAAESLARGVYTDRGKRSLRRLLLELLSLLL